MTRPAGATLYFQAASRAAFIWTSHGNGDLGTIGNPSKRSSQMKDEVRSILSKDIDTYRKKIEFYKSLHLFEAAHYADKLAANIELALTTMPRGDDLEIS